MTLTFFLITIVLMMASLIYFPKIKLGKMSMNTHWVIVMIGAIWMLLCGIGDFDALVQALFSNDSMNPLKLVVLFICVTILSLFLDKVGFFKYLAYRIIKSIHGSQIRLFFAIYILTSCLTIFTSNDVMILTFTPLVIYFSKSAKINPLPYLFSILTTANTWSIMLLIGNPTNIYLGTTYGIDFLSYLSVMWLPAILAGVGGFAAIYLIFRKTLKKPMGMIEGIYQIQDKSLLFIGLFHLLSCIIFMAISNLIHIQMWLVALVITASLTISVFLYLVIKKRPLKPLKDSYMHAPWSFMPMILSMFVLVQGLSQSGFILELSKVLDKFPPLLSYGISSHFMSNAMNNQPMSMLYAEMIVQSKAPIEAVYASIIGSNTAVLFTPFGALAGLMWFELLEKFEYKMTLKKYVLVMFPVGIFVLMVALAGLWIMIH